MTELKNVTVVLPSLDPDEKLGIVIDGLLEYGFSDILLVNDGSKEENFRFFEEAARHPQVTLLHHPRNLGKGAALKTAFRYVLENRPDSAGVVTVDGDGQHHPEDTGSCALHMLETGRLTLGVRDFSLPEVPERSRFGNRATSLVFKVFVGLSIADTQTGLRAIPRRDLAALTAIAGDRFEYETNMLLAMKEQSIPFDQVKILTVYIEENKSSHFRAVRDSWRIYRLILAHFFKYTASSLVSALVDEGLFLLLTWALAKPLSGFALKAVPVAAARVVSSLLNYYLNHKLVFRSRVAKTTSLGRYSLLAVGICLGQMVLTHGICLLFRIGEQQLVAQGVVYALVMTLLFGVSFLAQQRWVFANKK